MNLRTVWDAGLTWRWHTNPYLAHTGDTVAAHSGRMGNMALTIWGDERLACLCLVHDLGEALTGDLPWPFKRKCKAIAEAASEQERAHVERMGLSHWWVPDPRVKLLDRIDAYLWAQLHRPDIMETPDWIEARQDIWQMTTDDAELQRKVVALICDTEKRA